ncbi:MAG: T9SS type A sorting domain-containing protein [Flavobacterium psychrophilum]
MKNNTQFFVFYLLILLSSSLSAQPNFNISDGTKFICNGEITIDYSGGTFTNDGTITNTEGTLRFSSPVTFAGSGTTNTKNLTVTHSGTSLLSNRISVTGTLTVSAGTLNANNNLSLVSNSAGSAVIAPVLGSITGKVTVQRYIAQGKRAFRFLTPGVTTDDFISNNWQLGTHVTGSTTGANGFDTTVSGNPSMYIYTNQQATGSGWAAIANTNAINLNAMQGYRLLIRGDRTPTLITQASQPNMNVPVTLSATGTVTTGTVTFSSNSSPAPINNTNNTTTAGYSLIGNPYVNTVNWNVLTKTGLSDAYYSWDANMGTTLQRGRYVAYSSATGTNNVASNVTQYIQPGQAFFVKNSTLETAGSITFNETDKLGTNITNFYRNTAADFSRLELQVYQTSELAFGAYPIDAAVSVFDNQFTNAIENGDVTKLSTGVENISFLNSNLTLAIDARPQVVPTDELVVQIQQFQANSSYTFRTHFNNFDPSTTPFLVDTYLNQYTALANTETTDVAFTTTSDALSYGTNRFKIVFQNSALTNLNFDAENVVVYPNPVTKNQFNIALPSYLSGEVGIKVINTMGQIVFETKTEAQSTLNIAPKMTLSQGLYFVDITNQGKSVSKKLIIQ